MYMFNIYIYAVAEVKIRPGLEQHHRDIGIFSFYGKM